MEIYKTKKREQSTKIKIQMEFKYLKERCKF